MARSGIEMSQRQRLEHIRGALNVSGEVAIRQLAGVLGVSEMTVRRDLAVLEEKGEAIRIHGGAAPAGRVTFEFRFRAKQQKNLRQKRAIAAAALKHVREGASLILDTGTTTLELARQLVGERKVKVITTSLSVVSALQFDAEIEIILLGGHLRDKSPDLHGPLTEQNLGLFKADAAFVGADAIDAEGSIYSSDLRVLTIDRKMAEVSRRLIVLADSSKLDQTALCKVFSKVDYQLLITDSGVSDKTLKRLGQLGIEVEVCHGGESQD